jgi:CHAT domain-containing protein
MRFRALRSCILLPLCALASIGAAAWPSHQAPAGAPSPAALVDQLASLADPAARAAFLDAHAPELTMDVQRAAVARGIEVRRAGRLDEAGNLYLAAHDIADRLGDPVRAAFALINYSSIPGQQADYPTALDVLNRALATGESLGNDEVIGAALANLAIVYRLLGDYDHAIATNERTLALARRSGDAGTEGRVLHNLALIYALQGHYRPALDLYQQSLAIKERLHEADLSTTINSIGTVYDFEGNSEAALEWYQRAQKRAEEEGNQLGLAAIISNIGHVYRSTGRRDLALQMFHQVLAVYEKIGHRIGIAMAHYNIGSVRHLQGRLDEALAEFRQSLDVREAINDKPGMSETLTEIASVLADEERFDDAVAAAERAAALGREVGSADLEWRPKTVIGALNMRRGRPEAAAAAYREAVDAIEGLREEVAGGSESRERFLDDKLDAYRGLTEALIAEARVPDALAVAEQARGRVLAEVLERGDATARPLTAEEREQQRRLEQDVVTRTAQWSAARRRRPAVQEAVNTAAERLRAARAAADQFRDALDARYPVRRLARGASGDPLVAAQPLLTDDRTALVEYVVADRATYIFVLRRSAAGAGAGLRVFTSRVDRAALGERVERLRHRLATRALDFHPDARALYDLLLLPARPALAGVSRLIVVPDNMLWLVPFSALEPAPGKAVLDTMAVSEASSIAVLRAMHDRASAPAGAPTLVVAADPASDLPRLPEADRQARALAQLYGTSRTSTLSGASATESRLRASAATATVLQFATHGVVDDASPMYSYLQLARGADDDAGSDGRLEAWEIQSMKLRARVAVLTACDTARGRISGEGVIGLAWAFFMAGTPATVVSLWQLESASATDLTVAFHRDLRAGLLRGHPQTADSLRAAALALRRDPRYRHPFYWAGVIAVGDGF